MNKITVTQKIEDDIAIVEVPLENSDKTVSLYQQDFDYLVAHGLSPRWKLTNRQIVERGTNLSVTRLVAGAKAKQRVTPHDGNPHNLKKSNLVVQAGGNGQNTMSKLLNGEERPHRLNPITITRNTINPKHLEQIV